MKYFRSSLLSVVEPAPLMRVPCRATAAAPARTAAVVVLPVVLVVHGRGVEPRGEAILGRHVIGRGGGAVRVGVGGGALPGFPVFLLPGFGLLRRRRREAGEADERGRLRRGQRLRRRKRRKRSRGSELLVRLRRRGRLLICRGKAIMT